MNFKELYTPLLIGFVVGGIVHLLSCRHHKSFYTHDPLNPSNKEGYRRDKDHLHTHRHRHRNPKSIQFIDGAIKPRFDKHYSFPIDIVGDHHYHISDGDVISKYNMPFNREVYHSPESI